MMLLSAVFDSLGHFFGPNDFFWSNPIFEKELWEGFTKVVRIFLAVTAALLIILEIRARRMGVRVPGRWKRRIAWGYTIIAFGVYFDFGNPNTRYSEYYHRHEFYHYYLGSKYFKEVGYKRLYECTAIAEIEAGRGAQIKNREIRDLGVDLIKPMTDTYIFTKPELCKSHFSKERWDDFKKDVEWFYRSSAGSYWEGMQKDHGYNPPPVWTMTGKLFGSFSGADDKFFKILAGIDVLLHAGIILMFYWAFGWRVMAIAAVFWGANAPADFYWTGGAFLRQDWLFFLVAALCCARKRHFYLAGFALTWSMLLRMFPGLFVLGWAIIIAVCFIMRLRHHRPADTAWGPIKYLHPDHRRLIGGCVLALATLVPLSIWVAGPTAYKEFAQHTLGTHQSTPLTNHMGLGAMMVHNWEGRMRFGRDDNLNDPFQDWKKGRTERMNTLKPVFIGILITLFGWTVWALRRTKLLWVGTALSLPLAMSIENLTCYYYSMFIVGAALAAVRPTLGVPFLLTSAIGKLLQYPFWGFYWVDDRWVAESWVYFVLCLLFLYGYSRPFSFERLKAWWDGKPDPRPKKAADTGSTASPEAIAP